MRFRKLVIFTVLSVLLTSLFPVPAVLAQNAPQPETHQILITSLKTGSTTSAYDEYVEIFNQSSSAIDVTGWPVLYSTANDSSPRVLANLVGILEAQSFIVIASPDYGSLHADLVDYVFLSTSGIPDTGGHVTIKNTQGAVVDRLGWGSAVKAEGYEQLANPTDAAAPALVRGDALTRCSDTLDAFVDTDVNAADFRATPAVHFQLGPLCNPEESEPPQAEPSPDLIPLLTCEGVIISEVLPNPAGADAGKEYTELHNPSDEVIPLKGCSLQTSANKVLFALPDIELQPEDYRTFYDSETGLSLTNSKDTTVWLLSPTEELQAVTYPAGVDDDTSWILVGTHWHKTYFPTPDLANSLLATKPCELGQVRNSETNRCTSAEEKQTGTLSPCKPGQVRNPATNRCRSILTVSSDLSPCKSGQERNPDTNRCRAISSSSELKPCKEGQERNPETNRCRSVASASTTLKPCAEGQERNPDTNRCRKVSAATSSNPPASSSAGSTNGAGSQRVHWWVILGAGIASLGYAAYEWRRDIANVVSRLKSRPPKNTTQTT